LKICKVTVNKFASAPQCKQMSNPDLEVVVYTDQSSINDPRWVSSLMY